MGKDTIADIITYIRNADMNKKGMVQIPFTNITENTIKILLREGFVENVRKHRENNKDFLVLTLRYRRNRKGAYKSFLNLKRISTPGLRIYSNYQRIPRILGGMGIVILSTSRGIMTDREARLERIGGEVLCYIW
uniref:Small ribosomal subunit protein uS8c n=1 Tax=Haymondia wallichii TaxID=157659 RepID=A0A7H0QZM4_9FABA|nr:ribosomal protein S8 [Haymondia wallichii]QNQ64623.1 ribosomal protein S8 [Haymondia wallichii]UZA65215.1 ribosomal protein S8 [Haymondia wallichii]UZA65382.1 ribosomal protein S8 [Haymondia wallichii]UZA65466.1 ribosomal protein S8 [Haymondia wallichii]